MGDPPCMTLAGLCRERGFGVGVSVEKAADWYRKAAAWGDEGAMLALAQLCRSGQGVPLDLATADEWSRRAAKASAVEPSMSLFKSPLNGYQMHSSKP